MSSKSVDQRPLTELFVAIADYALRNGMTEVHPHHGDDMPGGRKRTKAPKGKPRRRTAPEPDESRLKIITKTVRRMRRYAKQFHEGDMTRTNLLAWADELDRHDARETRLDPSRRRS